MTEIKYYAPQAHERELTWWEKDLLWLRETFPGERFKFWSARIGDDYGFFFGGSCLIHKAPSTGWIGSRLGWKTWKRIDVDAMREAHEQNG